MYKKTRLALAVTIFLPAVLVILGSVNAGTTKIELGQVTNTNGKGITDKKVTITVKDNDGVTIITSFSNPGGQGSFGFNFSRPDSDWPTDAGGKFIKTVTLEFKREGAATPSRIIKGFMGDSTFGPVIVTVP